MAMQEVHLLNITQTGDTLWTKSYHVHLMCSLICSSPAGLYLYMQSKRPADGNHISFHCSCQTILGSCWCLASGVDTLVPAVGAVSSGGHFQTHWVPRGWSTFPAGEVLPGDNWLVSGIPESRWVGHPQIHLLWSICCHPKISFVALVDEERQEGLCSVH